MRPIVCLLVATVFLIPLMGSTALGAESTVTYYFDSYDTNVAWETNPQYMVDGNLGTFAETTIDGDVELLDGNTCPGTNLGTITKVELRTYGKYTGSQHDIILVPVFGGSSDGDEYSFATPRFAMFSEWFDITNDDNAPATWNWNHIVTLDCKVIAENNPGGSFTLYCSIVQIRVTYR